MGRVGYGPDVVDHLAASWALTFTSRCPFRANPRSANRFDQPSRVPIVLESSSKPCFSSCCVNRANLACKRMIARQERLLAMQDRRVGAGGVVKAIDLAGAERELDAAQ